MQKIVLVTLLAFTVISCNDNRSDGNAPMVDSLGRTLQEIEKAGLASKEILDKPITDMSYYKDFK